MPSRLDRLRAATRPARRWLASWLLAPLTTRRWVVVALVVLCLIGLLGCSTPAVKDPLTTTEDRSAVRVEAQRLRALYGDPRNWPAEEWARWEAMAREVTP